LGEYKRKMDSEHVFMKESLEEEVTKKLEELESDNEYQAYCVKRDSQQASEDLRKEYEFEQLELERLHANEIQDFNSHFETRIVQLEEHYQEELRKQQQLVASLETQIEEVHIQQGRQIADIRAEADETLHIANEHLESMRAMHQKEIEELLRLAEVRSRKQFELLLMEERGNDDVDSDKLPKLDETYQNLQKVKISPKSDAQIDTATSKTPIVAIDGRLCVRCGKNDENSPQKCVFHLCAVSDPGPLLYNPEWENCLKFCQNKTIVGTGCYTARDHDYGGAYSTLMATFSPSKTRINIDTKVDNLSSPLPASPHKHYVSNIAPRMKTPTKAETNTEMAETMETERKLLPPKSLPLHYSKKLVTKS